MTKNTSKSMPTINPSILRKSAILSVLKIKAEKMAESALRGLLEGWGSGHKHRAERQLIWQCTGIPGHWEASTPIKVFSTHDHSEASQNHNVVPLTQPKIVQNTPTPPYVVRIGVYWSTAVTKTTRLYQRSSERQQSGWGVHARCRRTHFLVFPTAETSCSLGLCLFLPSSQSILLIWLHCHAPILQGRNSTSPTRVFI